MSQNTSSAVMAQRVEPHDSLDFFPTPPWATRALCEWLKTCDSLLQFKQAWEPACGQGHMVRPLQEYFLKVRASDVHDYGYGEVCDFLWPHDGPKIDWIITNPPFRLGEQFILTALERANGVAVLVRTSFLEGIGRHSRLFSQYEPDAVLQFTERVPMHKGRLVENGSTATAYCWVVWHHTKPAERPTNFVWIPPCRRQLERSGDYKEVTA